MRFLNFKWGIRDISSEFNIQSSLLRGRLSTGLSIEGTVTRP